MTPHDAQGYSFGENDVLTDEERFRWERIRELQSHFLCKCGHERANHLRERLSCYGQGDDECDCVEFEGL